MRDAPFCAVLHCDADHRHVHIFLRVRPDGSVVSDSQNYRKNEAAARHIERELGMPAPTPVAPDKKVGDRTRVDAAARRSQRKGEADMDTNEMRTKVFEALAGTASPQAFEAEKPCAVISTPLKPRRRRPAPSAASLRTRPSPRRGGCAS